MWTCGDVNGYHYEIKHYQAPSEDYGIDGGKISKLYISKNRKAYACYDRGWDLRPDEEVKPLYDMLLILFN